MGHRVAEIESRLDQMHAVRGGVDRQRFQGRSWVAATLREGVGYLLGRVMAPLGHVRAELVAPDKHLARVLAMGAIGNVLRNSITRGREELCGPIGPTVDRQGFKLHSLSFFAAVP